MDNSEIRKSKAYLFDMDGVLVDNTRFHVESWIVYARRFGRELTPEEIKLRLGYNNAGYMAFILGRPPTPEEVADAIREKESLYRDLFRPSLKAPPGLKELLKRACREGVACAVVTSGPRENLDFVLDGLQIREYFSLLVDAKAVQRAKPAPDCYLLASERLKIPIENCIVFEDALAGIEAGLSAGARVVAVTTTYPADFLESKHPHRIIDSFSELLD